VNRVSTEQVLNKAYRLAYFLHQDKSIAKRIVAAATLKLNVAMAVQSKRLYYVPVGRFSPGESRRTDGIRNKALFSDLHLLQRLVYVESEPYERQKERAAQVAPPGVHAAGDPANEDDLLVYFIKHLVRITTKRNSFYVTLGVSRLLHSYSTHETMEIYNAVIGEPERVKDDYYYRSRKAVLMHEMYQRFGDLIRACRQRRGEERFETQPGSSELRSLVSECLRLFTPWDTQCPVPRDFDPFKSVIASLTSQSRADENRVEVNRIHAILHPNCFERLVAAFGYGPPEKQLELPRFFVDETNDQTPRQRNAPAALSVEELAEIDEMLVEQSGRRRRSSSTGVIRILVDGVERGRFNPADVSSISFTAEEGAELIEVKTTDPSGDLLLATYLLTSFVEDAHDAAVVASIRLEGGQYLSLSIARRPVDANGGGELLVKLGYRERDPRRAARLWWQRLSLRSPEGSRSLWDGRISAQHVLVATAIVAVIGLTTYLGYVRLSSRQITGPHTSQSTGPQLTSVQTNPPATPLPTAAPIPTQKAVEPHQAPAKATASIPNRIASQPPSRASAPAQPRDEDVTELTRSGNVVADLKLSEVKKVYIEMRGDAAFNELRTNIADRLVSTGLVTSATDANEADAALKFVVSQTSGGGNNQAAAQVEVSARLVNARGTVLWPKAGARRYSGETSKVVSAIVKDLSFEISQARGKH
jgi:hypothetical protein